MDVTCSLIEIQLKDGFIPLVSLISQNVSMIFLNVHLIFLFLIEKKGERNNQQMHCIQSIYCRCYTVWEYSGDYEFAPTS